MKDEDRDHALSLVRLLLRGTRCSTIFLSGCVHASLKMSGQTPDRETVRLVCEFLADAILTAQDPPDQKMAVAIEDAETRAFDKVIQEISLTALANSDDDRFMDGLRFAVERTRYLKARKEA